MKNTCLFFLLIFLSTSTFLFGQDQLPIAREVHQILPQTKVTASLPEHIKGEIPKDLTSREMAEMLRLNLVFTAQGYMHSEFVKNPNVIAQAILLDDEKYQLFKKYLTAAKASEQAIYESKLLQLY